MVNLDEPTLKVALVDHSKVSLEREEGVRSVRALGTLVGPVVLVAGLDVVPELALADERLVTIRAGNDLLLVRRLGNAVDGELVKSQAAQGSEDFSAIGAQERLPFLGT